MVIVVVNGIIHSVIDMGGFRIFVFVFVFVFFFFVFWGDGLWGWLDKLWSIFYFTKTDVHLRYLLITKNIYFLKSCYLHIMMNYFCLAQKQNPKLRDYLRSVNFYGDIMRTVLTFSVFCTQYSSGLFWVLDMVCHCTRLQPTLTPPTPTQHIPI